MSTIITVMLSMVSSMTLVLGLSACARLPIGDRFWSQRMLEITWLLAPPYVAKLLSMWITWSSQVMMFLQLNFWSVIFGSGFWKYQSFALLLILEIFEVSFSLSINISIFLSRDQAALSNCNRAETPLRSNVKLWSTNGEHLPDPTLYTHFFVSWSIIAFPNRLLLMLLVSLSQFIDARWSEHYVVLLLILRFLHGKVTCSLLFVATSHICSHRCKPYRLSDYQEVHNWVSLQWYVERVSRHVYNNHFCIFLQTSTFPLSHTSLFYINLSVSHMACYIVFQEADQANWD